MNKKWLMYALLGGAAYYFFFRKKSQPRVSASLPMLPTDSMAAGTTIPAVQGVIKNGQTLDIIQ